MRQFTFRKREDVDSENIGVFLSARHFGLCTVSRAHPVVWFPSYGFPKLGEKRSTQDRKYSVFPVGRLVNVRIEDYADSKEYEKLAKDLSRHCKGDRRVRQVYRNNGGTITIDCRK